MHQIYIERKKAVVWGAVELYYIIQRGVSVIQPTPTDSNEVLIIKETPVNITQYNSTTPQIAASKNDDTVSTKMNITTVVNEGFITGLLD